MDNGPAQPPADSPATSIDTGNEAPVNGAEFPGSNSLEWLNSIPNGTIFAYNLNEGKTPGGLKVRWKIRVATGAEAARWDARQADAIKELLTWATQQHRQHPR